MTRTKAQHELHPSADDDLGLYTATEEADFDHVAGLKGYTNLVTGSIVHAVGQGDDSCDSMIYLVDHHMH